MRERRHLTLVFAPLPDSAGGGAIVDIDGTRVVVLDERLNRRSRNAVLGHELVHDERLLFPPDTPERFVAKEEAIVRRITAERLVPLDELGEIVARIVELGDGVQCRDVEDAFDVPDDVAELALRLLARRPTAS